MPFKNVSDAEKRVPSIKNLPSKQKKAFVRIFNAIAKDDPNRDESSIIPVAISQAKKVKKSMDIDEFEGIDKATFDNIRRAVSGALADRLQGDREFRPFVFINDITSEHVIYDDDSLGLVQLRYTFQDNKVTFSGEPEPVNEITEFVTKAEVEGFLEKALKKIVSKFSGSAKGQEYIDGNVPVIKQFQEEEMVAIEPLYCPPGVADHHEEGADEAGVRSLVKSFNDNVDKISGNIGHAVNTPLIEPQKAWVNECDCYIGKEFVPEGQPIAKVKFHAQDLWEARKSGVLGGLSIGAMGHRRANEQYEGNV